jgi:hypothetical protein
MSREEFQMNVNSRIELLCLFCGLVPTAAFGQATALATWQVSLDNGVTWQSSNAIAPPSQASVLVRAQVTVFDNGVPFLTQTRARFAQAAMEAYVESDVVRLDQVAGVRTLQPGLPAFLGSTPFSTSQHGLTLKVDAVGDVTPPGQAQFLFTRNIITPVGSVPSPANPLTILQYQIALDGSLGDRTIRGGFFGFTGFITDPALNVGAGQIAVYPAAGALTAFATDITQVPVTLTVIPGPGVIALFACASIFTLRTRR